MKRDVLTEAEVDVFRRRVEVCDAPEDKDQDSENPSSGCALTGALYRRCSHSITFLFIICKTIILSSLLCGRDSREHYQGSLTHYSHKHAHKVEPHRGRNPGVERSLDGGAVVRLVNQSANICLCRHLFLHHTDDVDMRAFQKNVYIIKYMWPTSCVQLCIYIQILANGTI